MPISVRPPPEDGSLSPSGSPPSVVIEVTVPNGGWFSANLVTSAGPRFLEKGLLQPGTTRLRIFLPRPLPSGSLTLFVSDVSGGSGLFRYSI